MSSYGLGNGKLARNGGKYLCIPLCGYSWAEPELDGGATLGAGAIHLTGTSEPRGYGSKRFQHFYSEAKVLADLFVPYSAQGLGLGQT